MVWLFAYFAMLLSVSALAVDVAVGNNFTVGPAFEIFRLATMGALCAMDLLLTQPREVRLVLGPASKQAFWPS